MAERIALTAMAQEAWKGCVAPGAEVIDATAGNGQDTACLARLVGPRGRVYALDLQESALATTRDRLRQEQLLDRVTLLRADHARLCEVLPCGLRGRISLVCFNLGYRPSGDHALTTRPETTLPALLASLLLLSPAGALSVVAYRGHPGGLEEATRVEGFFNRLPAPWHCRQHVATGRPENPGPVWWLATQAG